MSNSKSFESAIINLRQLSAYERYVVFQMVLHFDFCTFFKIKQIKIKNTQK